MISFAQNFEDVLLERLFKNKKRGFYVDVGAWDPRRYSITHHFYDRGWRGVNIEPIARRHQLFVDQRGRDDNLLQLIGSETGTQRFAECVDEDYLSTTVTEIADELRRAGHEVVEYDVNVTTLGDVFEQYCPKVVDFLKVDTEGSEAEVLRSIDLTRFRPRALVIESTVPGSGLKSWDEPDAYGTWAEWEQRVLDADYVFAHFDGLNRFYLRREDAKLAKRLILPPGIYDGIDCTDNWQSRATERLEVIDRQQAEIASLREQSAAAEALRQTFDGKEAESAAQEKSIAELEDRLVAVEDDRVARLTLIERLTAERDDSREALAAAERTVTARIEAAVKAERASRDRVVEDLVEQLGVSERGRAGQLDQVERLTAELKDSRRALAEAGQAMIERLEAVAEADRLALGGLVERLGAVERDRDARLELIERLTGDIADSRRGLADAERAAAARMEAFEADQITRGGVIEGLVDQLGAVERDRAARLALIERLAGALEDSRKALADAEHAAAARIEVVEADRAARGEVIDGLVNQLGTVERDRAARLALIERLTDGLEDSRKALGDAEQAAAARIEVVEADRAARGEVIEGLVNQLGAVERDRAARLALIERLTDRLEDSRRALGDAELAAATRIEVVEADRVARGEVIDGLINQLGAVERDRAARLALIERLTDGLEDSRKALGEAEQAAAARIEVIEADRIARGEVIESLVNQLAAVERDRGARLALIERLTVDLDDSRAAQADEERIAATRLEMVEVDRAARGQMIGSLRDQLAAIERDRAARLALIERLTAERDEGRTALLEAERAGSARLQGVEADRVARGEVIDGLAENLEARVREIDQQLAAIDRLADDLAASERKIEELEKSLEQRDARIVEIDESHQDLTEQFARLDILAIKRNSLLDQQSSEIVSLVERLDAALADAALLRHQWPQRLFSFVTGRR